MSAFLGLLLLLLLLVDAGHREHAKLAVVEQLEHGIIKVLRYNPPDIVRAD
jgi:hypothetical protein